MTALEQGIIEALAILNSPETQEFINQKVKEWYDKGLSREESKYFINFVRDEKRLNLIQENVADLIKDVTDDLRDEVRRIIKEAQINNGNLRDIRRRLKDLFKGKDLTVYDSTGKRRVVGWKERIKTISRTESNRAANLGHLDSMRQLPVKMRKYVSITLDDRTSDISKAIDAKYGTPEKSIPIDEDFEVTVKQGKKTVTIKKQAPPFHPNERDRIMFISQRKYEESLQEKKSIGHDELESKHKYIKREGTPGNYRYTYPGDKSSKKQKTLNLESEKIETAESFFKNTISFSDFFSNIHKSSETWDLLQKQIMGDVKEPTYETKNKARRDTTISILESKEKELKEKITNMVTKFDYDTPESVIRESKQTAMLLGLMGYGFNSREDESTREEVISKLTDILDNDTKQINKALKYMNFKERVTKKGIKESSTLKTKTPEEIRSGLKRKTYRGGVEFYLSDNYIKNSSKIKTETDFNKKIRHAVGLLPKSAVDEIKSGNTKIHFITRTEAKNLNPQMRNKKGVLAYYVPQSKDVYVFPDKGSTFKHNVTKEKILESGYSEEVANKLMEVKENDSFSYILTHELGHAVALNKENKEIQKKWDDFAKTLKYEKTKYNDNFISRYAQTNGNEDFAETFAYYATNKQRINNALNSNEGWLSSTLKEKMRWMRENLWQEN